MNTMARGALIVFEGCDRAGKSTQVKLLLDALINTCGIPAESRRFPNRETATGAVIDQYLQQNMELPVETSLLLFSANRWECKDDIKKTLLSGKTIIVDRYAGSGAAYGAANSGRPLNWCKEMDRGLPAPDLVVFLKVDEKIQEKRSGWGNERFETRELQKKVAENFLKLADDTWKIVDAGDIDVTHSIILKAVNNAILKVKDSPIKTLYGPDPVDNR